MKNFIEYATPPKAPPPMPVNFLDLRNEWRIGREALRLSLNAANLARLPRGHGQPVILIPGWLAPEASMAPLRRLLRLRGYDAQHWGLGINRGDPGRDAEIMVEKVAELARKTGKRVGMVGWSLGGVIARETARFLPEHVYKVVTYGTPVVGGPTYTVGARRYGEDACTEADRLIKARDAARPITTPMSIIFSKRDTIVSWPACIDRANPNVTHFEVNSTHFSMGFDPTVWGLVVRQLAA